MKTQTPPSTRTFGRSELNDLSPRTGTAYAVAIAGPLGLALILTPLRETVVGSSLILIMVVPLVAAALLGGRGPAVVAAVATTAGHDFFLTAPYHSFSISATEDVIATLVLLGVGLAIGELVVRTRHSESVALAQTMRVESMRRVAGVEAGADRGWLIMAACQELIDTLDADEIEYVPGAVPPTMAVMGHGRVTVPCRTTSDRDRWTMALPVESLGRPVGYFDVSFAPSRVPFRLPVDAKAHAVALADVLGAALTRLGSFPSAN